MSNVSKVCIFTVFQVDDDNEQLRTVNMQLRSENENLKTAVAILNSKYDVNFFLWTVYTHTVPSALNEYSC
jgi:hypothetical protein